jgi:hypothetical protein
MYYIVVTGGDALLTPQFDQQPQQEEELAGLTARELYCFNYIISCEPN